MRCSGSPTTSSAPERLLPEALAAGRAFEAMLFAALFRPLAKPMGFFGQLAVGAATATMTAGRDDALIESIARSVGNSTRSGATNRTPSLNNGAACPPFPPGPPLGGPSLRRFRGATNRTPSCGVQ